jgi:serine/threonine protein kinase/Tol biopolymer transport system component
LPLQSGARLGPYEIIAPLGQGGMGEVYKARDTRLERNVAIKVSKDQFSERFEREARAVAALNHSHVCQLYDVGPNYLVMEYVEGAPVRPTDNPQQLLDLATQMADGLAAAHAAGIVHRDLKPGNVLVTRSGQVKILDFGLAMIGEGSVEAAQARVTEAVTDPGATVGTVAYMSPEQARGQTVDARTDLWSLGVVLYEMATRVRPFDGPTAAVIFEAVLSKAPMSVRQRNPKVSPELERIVDKLLEKDKALRYQSAADVIADLKRVERDSSSGHVAVATAPPPGRAWTRYAIAAVVVAGLMAGGAALVYSTKSSGPVTSPSEYVQLTNFNDSATAPSLSPDGRMVTFIRGGAFCCIGGNGQIYVKLLPGGEAVPLTTDPAPKLGPVFAPDGSRVAYTVGAPWETWTVPVLGGQPTRLLPNAFGLSWIADQRVMFSEIKGSGLHLGVVTSTEGRADRREIYFPAHERGMAHFSHRSPDGKSVLIVEMDRTAAWQPCRIVPFDGSAPGRQVGPEGACLATGWSPDGRWMYFSAIVGGSSHLWRQRFPDGTPEQITFGPTEEEGVAVAPDGRSIVTSVGTWQSAIWMHDATGEHAITSEGFAIFPRLSRDGTLMFYLAKHDSASPAELRVMDLASGRSESVLPGSTVIDYDVSRDGQEVAFATKENGGESQIWLAALDRRSAPRRVGQAGDSVSFGADGDLIFRLLEEKRNFLARIKKDGSGLARITDRPINDKFGVSPDGDWAIVGAPAESEDVWAGTIALPLHGGAARKLCAYCPAGWSSDGKYVVMVLGSSPGAKGLLIPTSVAGSLPNFPAGGINMQDPVAGLPGARLIDHGFASVRDLSTYVFVKTDLQRNLFRIPLH